MVCPCALHSTTLRAKRMASGSTNATHDEVLFRMSRRSDNPMAEHVTNVGRPLEEVHVRVVIGQLLTVGGEV